MTFIRECVNQMHNGPQLLVVLSERYCAAAAELGLRHVPGVFLHHHGRLTAMHYRTAAAVLPLISFDIIDPTSALGSVLQRTVTWYWSTRRKSFSAHDLTDLEDQTEDMRAAWDAFDTAAMRQQLRDAAEVPAGAVLDLPKFHRGIAHVVEYIRRFGPVEYLTTETSESLHKPLKMIFKWCGGFFNTVVAVVAEAVLRFEVVGVRDGC